MTEDRIFLDYSCPKCHGQVGHLVNCPDGVAFTKPLGSDNEQNTMLAYQGSEGGEEEMTFAKDLEHLINKHSIESASNTPDFILAQYVLGCLEAFNCATQQRETWHGRDARPSMTKEGIDKLLEEGEQERQETYEKIKGMSERR